MHRALDASWYLSRIPVQSQAHDDAPTKCNSSIFYIHSNKPNVALYVQNTETSNYFSTPSIFFSTKTKWINKIVLEKPFIKQITNRALSRHTPNLFALIRVWLSIIIVQFSKYDMIWWDVETWFYKHQSIVFSIPCRHFLLVSINSVRLVYDNCFHSNRVTCLVIVAL